MRFEAKNFQSWTDKIFDLFPKLHFIILSTIIGIFIYVLGFIISLLGDFTTLYIKTYSNFLLIFGVIWVFSCLRWGRTVFFNIINDDNFIWNKNYYEKKSLDDIFKQKIKIFECHPSIIIISLILSFSFYFFIIYFWFFGETWLDSKIYFAPFISSEWFINPSIYLKLSILLFFATPVGFLIGTGGMHIILFVFHVIPFVSNNLILKSPFYISKIFKDFTRISLISSYTWFVGVAIASFALHKSMSYIAWIYLTSFILLGLILFFIPQFLFHIRIKEKKVRLLEEFENKFLCIIPFEKSSPFLNNFEKVQYFSNLILFYKTLKNAKTWVLDYEIFSKLIISSLTPILITFIRMVVYAD